MPIAFDSSVDGGDNGGASNSLTFAFNNVAGNILFVGLLGDSNGGADDITGVTYDGVPCILVAKRLNMDSIRNVYLYVLTSPSTGSHNVVINCTGTHYLLAGAVSYSGASTSGQPDNSTTNSVTNSGGPTDLITSLSSVADNCWHMLVEDGYDDLTPTTPPTLTGGGARRVYGVTYGNWGLFDSNSAKTPAGSVSIETTYAQSTFDIAHIMASFKPPGPYKKRLTSKLLRMRKQSIQPSRGSHV